MAEGTELGQALIPVRATLDKLDKDLGDARGKVDNSLKSIEKMAKLAMGGVAAVIGSKIIGSAVGLVTSAIKDVVDSTTQWGGQLDLLGDLLGMSGEQASGWAFAMNKVGLSVEEGGMGLNYFSRQLSDASKTAKDGGPVVNDFTNSMRELGINVRDSSGNLKNFDALMPEIMDAFQKLPAGVDASAVAMKMFGARGGAKFLDFLRMGSQGMKEAIELSKMLGLQMSTEGVNAIEQYGFSVNTLGLAWTGFKNQIGSVVIPVFDALTQVATGALAGINTTLSDPKNQKGIRDFSDGMVRTLSDLAISALEWGTNITVQLATGLAEGLNIVADVMATLAGILSSWLEPGSPPRVAPNLDKWGQEAMTLYLNSWLSGDFSAFDAISREIQDSLNAEAILGNMKQVDVIPTLLGSRAVISEALDELKRTGAISEETFNKVIESAGPAGEKVRGLLQAYVGLQQANTVLTKATDKYNAAQDEVTAAQKAMIGLEPGTPEYEQARATLDAAIAKRDQAQAEKEVAQASVASSQEQVKSQKSILDIQQQNVDLLKQQNDLLAQLAGKATEAAPKEKGGAGLASMLDGIAKSAGASESAMAKIKEVSDKVKTSLENLKQPLADIQSAWARVKQAIAEFSTQVSLTVSAAKVSLDQLNFLFWYYLNAAATTVSQSGFIIQYEFWKFMNTAATTVSQIGFIIWYNIWKTLNDASTTVSTIGLIIETAFKLWLTNIANSINNTLKPPLDWLNDIVLPGIKKAFDGVGTAIGGVIDWIGRFITKIGEVILPWWLRPGSPTPLETGLVGVGSGADIATTAFKNMSVAIEQELNRVLGGPKGTIEDLQLVRDMAGKSMGAIGIPLQNAFFVVRDGAAAAGSAAGGALDALLAIKAIGRIDNWIYTHEVTVHEPDQEGGGGGGGGSRPKGRASGGWAEQGLPKIVGERGPELFIPSVSGLIIPNSQLRAMQTMSGHEPSAMKQSVVNIYGGLTLNGVQDKEGLLESLQEYMH